MAGIIPETQRGTFASARTGTPGVDNSVANAITNIAGSVDRVERHQAKEEAKRVHAEAQQSALRKRALTDSRTAIKGSSFSSKLDDLSRFSKGIEDYQENAAALLISERDSIEDDEERAAFSSLASKMLLRKGDRASSHFRNRELGEIETNLNTNAEANAAKISDLFSDPDSDFVFDKLEGFNDINDAHDAQLDKMKDALGADAVAAFKHTARVANARAALTGLVDSGATKDDIDVFINREVVGENLVPPDEVEKLKQYAVSVNEARK